MSQFEKIGFFALIIITLSTCQKADNVIVDDKEKQDFLSHLIMSRSQIYNVDFDNHLLSIALNKKVYIIDTHHIAYLYVDQYGNWTGDKLDTPVKGEIDSDGCLIIPNFESDQDGRIIVGTQLHNLDEALYTISPSLYNPSPIWAIANSGTHLGFFCSNGNNVIIPIVNNPNHILPEYFVETVFEKEVLAEEMANNLPTEQTTSYVFFTDAHWGRNQKHSPSIIKHIVDYSSVPFVLFGGDVITVRTETVQEALEIGYQFHDAFSFLGSRLYSLFGNHDDNSQGQESNKERHLSEEQVYSFLQSQMTNVDYWDYFNYSFDDSVSKTRFLCFDTGRLYAFRNSMFKTAQFAIESLTNVPAGWHIVAASHIWSNLKDYETGETKESTYVRPIIEILENYNLRKKTSFNYNGKTIEYDFSGAEATIEYCIGGHTHSDAVVPSKNGLPLITVTSDGQQLVAGGAPYKTGTINEQCVTIVVNDYLNRKVHIIHIGRGDDVSVDMWSPI